MLTGTAGRRLEAWWASRLPLTRFVPLAVLLAWAATASTSAAAMPFLVRCALAFSLLAQFRLWDDLVDRHPDRAAHPQRVLARATDARPFVLCAVVLGAANVTCITWLSGLAAGFTLLVLDAAAALWYGLHHSRALLHAHVVMLKYPAVVLLLASTWPPARAELLAAVLVYVAMCLFELLDVTPAERPLPRLALLHALLLATAAGALSSALASAAVLILAAAVVALRRHACGIQSRLAYVPFFAVALCLLTMKGGS